jgi:hypothetical protein
MAVGRVNKTANDEYLLDDRLIGDNRVRLKPNCCLVTYP